jgi:AAA domain
MSTTFDSVDTEHLDAAAEPRQWIWDGLLARGQVTLFTSMWKAGKTTLLSHLLAQRKEAGVLVGRPVSVGGSAIVSEEPASLWRDRHVKLGFGPGNRFFCRPFATAPSHEQWCDLLDHLADLNRSAGIDLVVIDPLSHFLPGREENNAALLLESLLPLRKLTNAGQAVVLVHHPRKASAVAGTASRGSGLLPAFVDVLLEMYPVTPGDPADRRRRLLGFSRDPATPRTLLIELNEAGSAFAVAAELPDDDEFNANWQVVHMVLEDASAELTRKEMLEQWPADYPRPKFNTLWTWLDQAFQRGLILRAGAGRRKDPLPLFPRREDGRLEGRPDVRIRPHDARKRPVCPFQLVVQPFRVDRLSEPERQRGAAPSLALGLRQPVKLGLTVI